MEGTRGFGVRSIRDRFRDEQGSIVPLVLGCFLLAMVLVAGGVAAGDAFVQQSDLQSVCDSAAVAGADAVDLPGVRDGVSTEVGSLPLEGVQAAVEAYLARDAQREGIQVQAAITPDGRSVQLACAVRQSITFGAMFGLGGGVTHRTSSSARAPLR